MTYIKSYLKAFYELGSLLGLIYISFSCLYGDPYASMFIYITLVTSLAGPLCLAIGGKDVV